MTVPQALDLPTVESRRKRILFVAEAVTLAHAARPFALAANLDPSLYEVHLAWDPRFAHLFPAPPGPATPLHSIPSARFAAALAKGSPIYDAETLRGYIRDDLALLERIEPDAVVGDFRLSLAVSAPLAGVPYLTVTNAYWSPYLKQRLPLPDLPLNRVLGVPASEAVFRTVAPLVFAIHARALNRVRLEHGLPSLGSDLRTLYTWADYTLYADPQALFAGFEPPPRHRFLGAVAWEPSIALPAWWGEIPRDRPVIYINLGSSGPAHLLSAVLTAVADLPVFAIAATAGREPPGSLPANARLAPYLPGESAAAAADLVVCNGGSPATQQALRAGKPVLALPSNMDQYLNMMYVERAGAGKALRAERTDAKAVRTTMREILDDDDCRDLARGLAGECAPQAAHRRFAGILAEAARQKSAA